MSGGARLRLRHANPGRLLMTEEYTRAATWQDVIQVARYLNEAGAVYMLVGGYALIAQGLNRTSEDIDILVRPDADNANRWIVALSRLPDGAARELAGETDLLERDIHYGIRINDEITVDVLGSVCGLTWDDLKAYLTSLTVDDVTIPILNLEGLLLTKQGVRPKDRMDAAILQRALEVLRATVKPDTESGPSKS
jgi:hypothetical protein